MQRRLLFFIFIFSALLFATNAIFLKYDLYLTMSYVDIITHTLGGIVVGGISMYFFELCKNHSPRISDVFFFVFFVGVVWEFFELYHGLMHTSDPGYYLDTAKDLFFDVFGSYIAYLFMFKKIYVRR